jgi:hypothetical protein
LIERNVRLNAETAATGGIATITGERRADDVLQITIEGELKPPLPRDAPTTPNFNGRLPSGRSIGLPDYEIAHLYGPGFGDEAWDGMMYAPREVNQAFQNHGIESRLRELQGLASREGATIRVTARAEGHPLAAARGQRWFGHETLGHASYRFEVRFADGRTRIVGEVDISVPPPGSRGRVTVEVTGGSAGVWSLQ